jgi:hypothetical protein
MDVRFEVKVAGGGQVLRPVRFWLSIHPRR